MLKIQAITLAAAAIPRPLPLVDFAKANKRPPVAQPSGEQRKRLGELREPYLDKSAPIDPPIGQLVSSPWAKFCGKGKGSGTKEDGFTCKHARTKPGLPVLAAVLIKPNGRSNNLSPIHHPRR